MSSSSTFSPDHNSQHHNPNPNPNLSSLSEQLCYVHCNFCDTVLAVSVPSTSLFKTVTVRCGHCTNLLSVNMRALLLPPANQFHHLGHSFFSPQNLLEELRSPPMNNGLFNQSIQNEHMIMPVQGRLDEIPKPPIVNRPPEKRQRVPSAYNRFIKDEIQRIKAGNPDISHREAFSAAAKNVRASTYRMREWAHFPHIQFGLMNDHQPVKKANVRQQEGDDLLMKDSGFFAAAANVGISPY